MTATTTKTSHSHTVVTWSDPRGNTIDICDQCRGRFEAAGQWPRNPSTGDEYCQVHHGAHRGCCDLGRDDD